MSGTNIKVAIRVRPLIASELQKKLKPQWSFRDNHIYQINSDDEIIGEPYSFDHIFPPDKSNKDIYDGLVDPFIQETLNGVNSTIFAYGQTSSGKTYTMLGNDTDSGILSLAIEKIFNSIDDCISRKFLLRISYIEIYNEKFIDLLSRNKQQKELKIRESNSQICLQGVTEEFVSKCEEVFDLIQLGNKNRHIAGTNMNERSSRSHTIFRMMIESTEVHDFDSKEHPLQISNLNFVDLAGSERVAQTKATGVRLKEGNYINKSLSALSLVIKQLSDGQDFVNFRDSKLTRLLQDSLGGNSNTLIITTITTTSVEDTLSTLNFAQRAKAVKNKPIINKIVSKQTTSERHEELIRQLSQQLQEQMSKNRNLEVEKDENSEHILRLQKQLNMLNNFQKNVANFNDINMSIPKRRHTIGFLQKQQQQQPPLQEFDDDRDVTFLTISTNRKTTMTPLIQDESEITLTGEVDDNDNNGDVNNKSTPVTPEYAIRNRLLFLQQDFDELTDYTRHEQDIIKELSHKVISLEKQLSETKCSEQKQLEIIDKLKNDVISIKNQQQEESDILIEQMRNKFITREEELLEKITSLEDELKEKSFNRPDDNIFNDCDRKDILNQLYQLQEILICDNKLIDNRQEQTEKEKEVLNNFQRIIDQYLLEIQSEIFNKVNKTKILVHYKDFDQLKTSILEYFNGGHDEGIHTIQDISILENLLFINEDLSMKSNTIQKLIEENLQLNNELTKSKEQLIEYRNSNSELQQQLHNAHRNYDDLKLDNDLLKNRFTVMNNEIDKLNNQIKDFESAINTYKLEKLDLVNSYRNKITELNEKTALELKKYQEQIVEFNKRHNSQMVEFKNIQLENQDLRENLYRQNLLIGDKNNEIDVLKNEITTLKNIISKLETENKNYRQQLTDYNQLTESINSYKLQIEHLNDKLKENKTPLPSTSSSSSLATTNSHSKLKEYLEMYQRTTEEICRLNLAYIKSILSLSRLNTETDFFQNEKIRNYNREFYNHSCSLCDKYATLRTKKPSNVDLYETSEIIKKSFNLLEQYNSESLDIWNLQIASIEQHYKKIIDEQKANCKQCIEYRQASDEYEELQNKYFKMFMSESDRNSELLDKIKSKDEQIQQLKDELWSIKYRMNHQSSTPRKPITKDCETECNIITMEMLETLTIKYEHVKGIARIRQQSINQLMKQKDNK